MKLFNRKTLAAAVLTLVLVLPALAEEQKSKTVTLEGEGKCAKCALKEKDKCQNALQVKGKDGKTQTYYLAENELSKGFHKNLCQGSKPVKAEGTVKEVDGKRELTVTKLELAK
jgi:hypothetical protein